jgi:four helix bundle protein
MATFHRFEEIVAWQKAKSLASEVYRVSAQGPLSRDVFLRDQMRRAAVSSMSNIAEGFERDGLKEFLQFLSVAKGSVGEIRSQLYLVEEQSLLPRADVRRLSALATETSRTIAGLMKYLRVSSVGGKRYRPRLET